MNEINITYQDQSLEIQYLKTESHRCIRLFLDSKFIPKDICDFQTAEWTNIESYKEKFMSYKDFIFTVITDLDSNLISLEALNENDKIDFANAFQPFLAKLLSKLLFYIPFSDELINTLDFVTLNMEADELKKKILAFNSAFRIVPFTEINNLSKEITRLADEDLTALRKVAKKTLRQLREIKKR